MAEFYHELITEKSFKTLQELRKKFKFILIGGWAVFLYTKSLKSKDIDMVIDYDELGRIKKAYALSKNDRLKKYDDRIAANGDAANKIGTYEKAVLAKENGIPFYIAAPVSTIDLACRRGNDIPIEERDEDEVLFMDGKTQSGRMEKIRLAPEGVRAKNPAFDVTPAKYITAIITNKGIVRPDRVHSLFSK